MPEEVIRGSRLWDQIFENRGEMLNARALQLHRRKTGWFPTAKAGSHVSLLRTRDDIVHDFLYLAETDYDVVRIAAFPLETIYWVEGRRGKRTEPHVADLALGHRDGSITFVDVRRYFEIASTPGEFRRIEERAAHYLESFDSAYVLHDERKIYPEPLFSNVKEMCELARPQARLPGYWRIREDILGLPLPMTVRQIMQSSSFNAVVLRDRNSSAAGVVLAEFNPVFEVIMGMVAGGELWVDEARSFGVGSVVCRTEITGSVRRRGGRNKVVGAEGGRAAP